MGHPQALPTLGLRLLVSGSAVAIVHTEGAEVAYDDEARLGVRWEALYISLSLLEGRYQAPLSHLLLIEIHSKAFLLDDDARFLDEAVREAALRSPVLELHE